MSLQLISSRDLIRKRDTLTCFRIGEGKYFECPNALHSFGNWNNGCFVRDKTPVTFQV